MKWWNIKHGIRVWGPFSLRFSTKFWVKSGLTENRVWAQEFGELLMWFRGLALWNKRETQLINSSGSEINGWEWESRTWEGNNILRWEFCKNLWTAKGSYVWLKSYHWLFLILKFLFKQLIWGFQKKTQLNNCFQLCVPIGNWVSVSKKKAPQKSTQFRQQTHETNSGACTVARPL